MKEPKFAAWRGALHVGVVAARSASPCRPARRSSFFRWAPAFAATWRPTAVEPVKEMPLTSGFSISSSPTAATLSREQVTTLNTPLGTPASSKISANSRPPQIGRVFRRLQHDGVAGRQREREAARATGCSGKFHGLMTGDHAHRPAHRHRQLAVLGGQDLADRLRRLRPRRRGRSPAV